VRCAKVALLVFAVAVVFADQAGPRSADRALTPNIPTLWDEKELAAMTLPPARQEGNLVYVSSDYFYATPGLQIYKTYPVYRPDREPRGYLARLYPFPQML
jgi:hypothetical protein